MFHEFASVARFATVYWDAYRHVNQKYAQVVAAHAQPGTFVWVHDYQLMLVAQELRALGVNSYVAFFLHIPFPPLDVFLKLPWRMEILRALVQFDLLGVQTARDRRNLLDCIRALMPEVLWQKRGRVLVGHIDGRPLGDFPISIDYHSFVRRANSPQVLAVRDMIRRKLPERKILLEVDRLDYTKGIPIAWKPFEGRCGDLPSFKGRAPLVKSLSPAARGLRPIDGSGRQSDD